MKKIGKLVSITLLLMAAGLFSACSSTAGVEGRKSEYAEQLRVNNPWLRPYLEIASLKTVMVGGVMKANVTLFSDNSDSMKLQYKFSWYDENGMIIERDGEPWKALNIYGKETKDIIGIAPNVYAKEFKVVIRERK